MSAMLTEAPLHHWAVSPGSVGQPPQVFPKRSAGQILCAAPLPQLGELEGAGSISGRASISLEKRGEG